MVTKGIEKVKERINEIIADNEKASTYLDRSDRFIEGKLVGYRNSLMLIQKYME